MRQRIFVAIALAGQSTCLLIGCVRSAPPSAATSAGSGELSDTVDVAITATPSAVDVVLPAPDSVADTADATDEASGSRPESTLRILDWPRTLALVEEHRGRVVVVNVWSLASESSSRQFPAFVALQAKYPKDVACVSVNCDYLGLPGKPPSYYRAEVEAYLRRQNAEFEAILCDQPADILMNVLDLSRPPAVYVFDRSGHLTRRFDQWSSSRDGGEFTLEADVAPWVDQVIGLEEL